MNRFIRKSWYTLTEAAAYLTNNTEGETQVTASDLLQLAEGGEITLTIRLFSDCLATIGDVFLNADGLALGDVPNVKGYPSLAALGSEIDYTNSRRISQNTRGLFYFVRRDAFTVTAGSYWNLTLHEYGKELLAHLWRDSYEGDTARSSALTPDALSKKAASESDAVLFLEPISPVQEGVHIIALYAKQLPEDTMLGMSWETLDALLVGQSGPLIGGRHHRGATSDEILPEELEELIKAWKLFWKNASRLDRTTRTKKSDVVSWLMERGLSKKAADAGATMISPDWARKGG